MKNKKCRGCEYYIIGGARRCRAIQQYLYEKFKEECVCRRCDFRPECIRKSTQVYKERLPNLIALKPLETCELFDYTLKSFIKLYPGYGLNTSYRDFSSNETYRIIANCVGPLEIITQRLKEKSI